MVIIEPPPPLYHHHNVFDVVPILLVQMKKKIEIKIKSIHCIICLNLMFEN